MGDPTAAQTFVTEVTTPLQNVEGISGAFEVKIAALEIGVSAQEDQRNRADVGLTEAFRQLQEVQEAVGILNIDIISTIVHEKIKTSNELQGRGSGGTTEIQQGFRSEGRFLKAKQSMIYQNCQKQKHTGTGIKDSRMQLNKSDRTCARASRSACALRSCPCAGPSVWGRFRPWSRGWRPVAGWRGDHGARVRVRPAW